jgi:hypothetical protein
MQAPLLQLSPAWQLAMSTQSLQPLPCGRHSSTAPVGPQWRVPGVQVFAQVPHAPLEQNSPSPHGVVLLQVLQPLASITHVSTPLPSQCALPTVHEVPQVPHAPPLQKLPHVWPDCQAVQPLASATQVCTVLPLQRCAPAVQVPLQAAQAPLLQREPAWQVASTHCVQPDSTSQSHSRTPVAVHIDAPMVHCWQELHWPEEQSSP